MWGIQRWQQPDGKFGITPDHASHRFVAAGGRRCGARQPPPAPRRSCVDHRFVSRLLVDGECISRARERCVRVACLSRGSPPGKVSVTKSQHTLKAMRAAVKIASTRSRHRRNSPAATRDRRGNVKRPTPARPKHSYNSTARPTGTCANVTARVMRAEEQRQEQLGLLKALRAMAQRRRERGAGIDPDVDALALEAESALRNRPADLASASMSIASPPLGPSASSSMPRRRFSSSVARPR
jgi:hypothetical protein